MREIITNAVSSAFEVFEDEWTSHVKSREYARARYAICMLMSEHRIGITEIAATIRRDRSTAGKAFHLGLSLMRTDKDFACRVGVARRLTQEALQADLKSRSSQPRSETKSPPARNLSRPECMTAEAAMRAHVNEASIKLGRLLLEDWRASR